jgi:hypothetical protein
VIKAPARYLTLLGTERQALGRAVDRVGPEGIRDIDGSRGRRVTAFYRATQATMKVAGGAP